MSWNTDRSPSLSPFVVALALCAVVVGPVGADVPPPHEEPTSHESVSASAATAANGAAEPGTASNGTATPGTNATVTPTPSPTPTESPTPAPTTTAADGAVVVSALETRRTLRVGSALAVNATVTNRATTNATETLRYSFGGSTVDSRTVRLGPGESTTVGFEIDFAAIEAVHGSIEPGTYVHGVRNESGGGVARRLRVSPDVDLTVEAFDAPVEVSHGEPYILLARVGNPGNNSITRTVAYEFAGRTVLDRAVTVAGRDVRQVAFEVRLPDVQAVVGPVENGTTYDHGVVTGEDRRGGAVRVVQGSSADASALAAESLAVTDDVRPGDSYTVDLSVRNVAATDFEGQLSYRVDGAAVATEWVQVPTGERRTVTVRVRYEEVMDAADPLSARETVHGVFVGDDPVVTRPVTVHAPLEAPTPTPEPPTFAPSTAGGGSSAPTPTASPTTTAPGTADGGCERGFLTACGGTAMDETSLTLLGVLLSGFGIVYEMVRGRR